VLALIIAATGKLAVVHWGGFSRSNVDGPPQRSTTLTLQLGFCMANCGTPLIFGHGLKLSLPSETPW
jgi:hypothetical protein